MPTVIILAALFFGSLMSKSHRDEPADTALNQSIFEFYLGLLPQSVQDMILRFAPRVIIFLCLSLVVFSVHSCMYIHSEGRRIRTVTDSIMASVRYKPLKPKTFDTALALKPLTVWDIARSAPAVQDDVSVTSPYRLNIRQEIP